MKNKLILIVGIIVVVILLLLAIFISPPEKEIKEDLLGISYEVEGNEAQLNYDGENPIVAIYIKNYGSVVMELYPKIAPNTVSNFISLIQAGFYDGNSFHRLMPGFVLQGGDPNGNGSGGPGYSIKGEFTNNGFENSLSHKRWVVSMARGSDSMDSAGSQFFICLKDATYLDGNYAAFGKVIDGFDALEAIEENESVMDSESGQLRKILVIEKVLVDLKGKEYPEVEKIEE